jgi:hypothetical protein
MKISGGAASGQRWRRQWRRALASSRHNGAVCAALSGGVAQASLRTPVTAIPAYRFFTLYRARAASLRAVYRVCVPRNIFFARHGRNGRQSNLSMKNGGIGHRVAQTAIASGMKTAKCVMAAWRRIVAKMAASWHLKIMK